MIQCYEYIKKNKRNKCKYKWKCRTTVYLLSHSFLTLSLAVFFKFCICYSPQYATPENIIHCFFFILLFLNNNNNNDNNISFFLFLGCVRARYVNKLFVIYCHIIYTTQRVVAFVQQLIIIIHLSLLYEYHL